MQYLMYAVSIIGLVLGLISAWPRIADWVSKIAARRRDKRKSAIARYVEKFEFAARDTGYFVAYLASLVLVVVAAMALIIILQPSSPAIEHPITFAIFALFRIAASLVAGLYFGRAIALCWQIMERYENENR